MNSCRTPIYRPAVWMRNKRGRVQTFVQKAQVVAFAPRIRLDDASFRVDQICIKTEVPHTVRLQVHDALYLC